MKNRKKETLKISQGAPPIPPVDGETLRKISMKSFEIEEGLEVLTVCWVEEWQAVIATDEEDKEDLTELLPAGTRILLPEDVKP